MRARTFLTLGTALFWALACAGGDEADTPEDGTEEGDGEEEGDGGDAEGLWLDYPSVSLEAEEGQFVLAPGAESVKSANENEGGTLIYYGGHVLEVGDTESKIKSEAGTEFTVPNAVVLPIASGQKARPGSILLGHWESGSGLQRAIVIEGGTPAAPKVRYLDMDDREDEWEADRFQHIKAPFDLGTTMACGDGEDRDHGILVGMEGDRVLVSGFASKLEAFDKSECVSLLPNDTYSPGDQVFIPKVGRYNKGTVKKVEAAKGLVHVEYEWGGKTSTEPFPIIDVTKTFEQGEGGKGGKAGKGKGKGKGKAKGKKPAPKPTPRPGGPKKIGKDRKSKN